MKRTLRGVYATLILAVSLFAFAACSSDEPKESGPKELPSFTDLTVAPGDTGEIAFNAYDIWKLSSNKIWFKLSANTGPSGDQKVTYTVTDDGQAFESEEVTLTFQIGNQSKTFKAVRSSKDRVIKFYTRIVGENENEYKEVTAIDLTYHSNAATYQANIAVVANFDWKLTAPAWVSIDQDNMSGDANQGAESDLSKLAYKWVQVDFSKAEAQDMKGELLFTTQTASDYNAKLNITCPGSDIYMLNNALFEVKLNSDGQYVPQSNIPQEYYSFKVTAGKDGVIFFKIAKDGDFYGVDEYGNLNYNANWCQVFPNDTETILGPAVTEFGYDLKAQVNQGTERSATVVALPRSIVMDKGITNSKDLVATGDKELKAEYQQYIVTDVTQSGATKEIAFAYSAPEGIKLEKLAAGSEDYDFIHSEYNIDLVYQLTYNSFEQINMCMLNYNGYTGDGNLVPSFNPSENENTGSKGWINMETNGGMSMTIGITDDFVPFTGERYTWIIVKDQDTHLNEFAIKVIQKVAR